MLITKGHISIGISIINYENGEGNQACYPIKYEIKLINIIHNIVQ